MKDEKQQERADAVEQTMRCMPKEMQRAILWMLDHFDYAVDLCCDPVMAQKKINPYLKEALQEEDYFQFTLLCLSVYIQVFGTPDIG